MNALVAMLRRPAHLFWIATKRVFVTAQPATIKALRINQLPKLGDVAGEWVEFDSRRYARDFARLATEEQQRALPLFTSLYDAEAIRSAGIEAKGLSLIQMQALLAAVLAFVWTDTGSDPRLIAVSILAIIHLLFACYSSLQLAETRARFMVRPDDLTRSIPEILGLLEAIIDANSRVTIRLSNLAASAKQDTWRALVFTLATVVITAI